MSIGIYNFPAASSYMPRARIDSILNEASKRSLVFVTANAGYGKTQAVSQYIAQQSEAVVRWIQLTDSDNISSIFWEHLTRNISEDNPELSSRMRELGFPETSAQFKMFTEILLRTEHRSHKTFVVLDDFHLLHSEKVLMFIERYIHLQIQEVCAILVSRREPDINVVSLFADGHAYVISEEELRFTADELASFLEFKEIHLKDKDILKCYDATKGWAMAIQLLSLALRRKPKNLNIALSALKENIYKMFESEAFADFPLNLRKALVKASLLSDIPLSLLKNIFSEISSALETSWLTAFIWHDSLSGDYLIHPLYIEFLQSKQELLSDDEKTEAFAGAADWCSDNELYMDAVKYYSKSQKYDRMIEIFLSYPFKLPYDTCEYFLDVISDIDPNNKERNDYSVLLIKNFFVPLFLLGMGRYQQAYELCLFIIKEWENTISPFTSRILQLAYSNLTYIDMYICTSTHEYKAPEYLRKSIEYFEKGLIEENYVAGAFTVPDIRSFACLVGEGATKENFDEFLIAVRKTTLYISKTRHNMYSGYEDLVACELAFFKNQQEDAKNYANDAIMRARERSQYSIETMAIQYLMRIAVGEGNYPLVSEMLRQLRNSLDNPDFWNRQLLFDLFVGNFYIQMGMPHMVPSWLIMNDKDATYEVRIPARELIVCVKCCIALKEYSRALTILLNSYPREPKDRFLIGELIISLLTAVIRLHTNDEEGALRDFIKAYELSFEGMFEMPFIELGRDLSPLVTAVKKHREVKIPNEWLTAINRKASAYAKKAAVVVSMFKKEMKVEDTVLLSKRELEILYDLSHGLSREEISAVRYISMNTVKKILQSIYIKLDAKNSADAIRIAIQKRVIL